MQAYSRTRVVQLAIILATATLLLMLGWALLVFLEHSWRVLQFPYPIDYGEGPLLDQVVRLSQFQEIYRSDLSTPPFILASYPPLYQLLQAPLVALFGPTFWFGRAISVLSIICVAVLIALTLRHLTRDWLASTIGGLVFLSVPYVVQWASLLRVDNLALALSWGGLFIITRYPERRWSIIATSVLLVAAIFTRQSYLLAAPVTAVAWLMLNGLRRHALVLALAVVGTTLSLALLLNLVTQGGFFFHVVATNTVDSDVSRLWLFVTRLVELIPLLLLAGALFLLIAAVSRVRSWLIIGVYLVAGALSGLTIAKAGSNINYWLELVVGLSLASGALLAWLRPFPTLRIIALLLLAVQVNGLRQWTQEGHFNVTPANRAEVMKVVRASEGPVITDDFMGLLPLDRRPILIEPFGMTLLAHSGMWDQRPFLDALDRGEFATIIVSSMNGELDPQRWTEEMQRIIRARYKVVNRIGAALVYKPDR